MSLLGPDWKGRVVLDACAGSGAFGFEALSRGAQHAVLIDAAGATCRQLHATAEGLGVGDRVDIRRGRFQTVASRLPPTSFDLIFVDPPYDDPVTVPALTMLAGLLRTGGRLVVEHTPDRSPPPVAGALVATDVRRWGGTAATVYRIREEEEEER